MRSTITLEHVWKFLWECFVPLTRPSLKRPPNGRGPVTAAELGRTANGTLRLNAQAVELSTSINLRPTKTKERSTTVLWFNEATKSNEVSAFLFQGLLVC